MRKSWARILYLTLSTILIAAAAQAATSSDWSVTQMSGRVTIAVGGTQPVALTRGAVLSPGGVLTTGLASRAFLVRSEETINVGPNAAIAIPGAPANRQFTTILENAGVVEFTADKQNVQHFAVETPYLAAVVKGTQFSVEVTRTGATVRVTRGVVEVTALATGILTNLQAGQAATVRPDGTLTLAGPGPRPDLFQGKPRAPIVAASFASSTPGGGLFGPKPSAMSAQPGSGPASVEASLGGGSANVSVGGVEADVSAGAGSASASVSAAGIEIGAGIGGGGGGAENVAASAGNVGVTASADGGGVNAAASVGSVEANASVSSHGVELNVGGAGVSASSGGAEIDLGPIHLGLGR